MSPIFTCNQQLPSYIIAHYLILMLCFLVDFTVHIDTIRIGLAIVYFKGSQVEFSNL